MNLKYTILSERNNHKGSHIVRFPLYKMSRIGKSIEVESRFACGWELGGKWGVPANEVMNMF